MFLSLTSDFGLTSFLIFPFVDVVIILCFILCSFVYHLGILNVYIFCFLFIKLKYEIKRCVSVHEHTNKKQQLFLFFLKKKEVKMNARDLKKIHPFCFVFGVNLIFSVFFECAAFLFCCCWFLFFKKIISFSQKILKIKRFLLLFWEINWIQYYISFSMLKKKNT